MTAYKGLAAIAAAFAASFGFAAAAAAYETHGVDAKVYASGFSSNDKGVGPIGIGFDSANTMFVVDSAADTLHRFTGPGTASAQTQVGAPLEGDPKGLAIGADDRLYLARYQGDVVEIDRNTGAVLRKVANVPCAIAPAIDHASGDLFVTAGCGHSTIFRITGPAGPAPAVSPYGSNLPSQDGIGIAPDGTLFVISRDGITEVQGTRSSAPGTNGLRIEMLGADGLGIAPGSRGKAEALIVTRTNGLITRVDLTGSKPETRNLVSGASRGDLAAVDNDGCYYATMTDTVLRLTDPDGECRGRLLGGLTPTTPGGAQSAEQQGLLPDPPRRGCIDTRKFTWRLHHKPDATVTSVDIYVDGKRRVRKRGSKIEKVTLRRLPQGTFRVRIVAKHSDGNQIISARRYKGCKKGKPRGRRGGRSSR